MGDRSGIEWTDATWNPIRATRRGKKKSRRGWFCVHASEGCRNCYAEKMNQWRGNGLEYSAGNVSEAVLELNLEGKGQSDLTWPLRAGRPRKIFPCSMTDLFGEFVPNAFIDQIIAVCWLAKHHTFQIVTKRAERARDYLLDPELPNRLADAATQIEHRRFPVGEPSHPFAEASLPLKNVWIGVSVEDQINADRRREPLREIAAQGWLTWVSYEPALGGVDWVGWEFICWLVAGGESGPKARPMHPEWVRVARDWCVANGVAFNFKQWGEWFPVCAQYPETEAEHEDAEQASMCGEICMSDDGYIWEDNVQPSVKGRPWLMDRIGKKAAGAMLDGREWRQYPEAT